MTKIVFDDGREVKLSEETVARLRDELLPKSGLMLDRLRVKPNNKLSGATIAIVRSRKTLWDGLTDQGQTNALGSCYFNGHEIQQLIQYLQKMMRDK